MTSPAPKKNQLSVISTLHDPTPHSPRKHTRTPSPSQTIVAQLSTRHGAVVVGAAVDDGLGFGLMRCEWRWRLRSFMASSKSLWLTGLELGLGLGWAGGGVVWAAWAVASRVAKLDRRLSSGLRRESGRNRSGTPRLSKKLPPRCWPLIAPSCPVMSMGGMKSGSRPLPRPLLPPGLPNCRPLRTGFWWLSWPERVGPACAAAAESGTMAASGRSQIKVRATMVTTG